MQTTVKQLMSGDPVSIEPGATALDAYEAMLRHGIRHLPVVAPDARVIGVITADDLAAALALPLRPRRALEVGERSAALEWCVGEIMTHAPQTLCRDATLADAAEQMAEGRFGCLPIVDESGRLEGLLSETDLLHAFANLLARERPSDPGRPAALAGLVAQLEGERARIAEQLGRYRSVEHQLLADSRERPMDLPERSAELGEVSLTARLEELATRRLAALDRALDHAAQGRLSRCDGCGGTISLPRLRALPGTTLCIDCARAGESS
jgi:CBS domain-containing protein/RNA polymerase-binding transcription factor DksA